MPECEGIVCDMPAPLGAWPEKSDADALRREGYGTALSRCGREIGAAPFLAAYRSALDSREVRFGWSTIALGERRRPGDDHFGTGLPKGATLTAEGRCPSGGPASEMTNWRAQRGLDSDGLTVTLDPAPSQGRPGRSRTMPS